MSDTSDLIYIVHGTNAHSWANRLVNGRYPWWRRWSLFSCALRQAFGKESEIREFRWSGRNTHQARLEGASQLASAIEKEAPGLRIHLIGHSHGANVALAAVNRLPPQRVTSVIVLANPNMALLESHGAPPEWLYWGDVPNRVKHVWNLYSPEDFVQTRLAERFHGVVVDHKKTLLAKPTYAGTGHQSVQNVEIHWSHGVSAHRAMHSQAIGTLAGKLLKGEDWQESMKGAGLSISEANKARDHGGNPGKDRTFETIREFADPSPFDLGNKTNEVGVLFVHGFTASPSELRPMAQYVVQNLGWRCTGLLLPGHGTHIHDMRRATGKDWISAVEHAYERLSGECDRVLLVGLSLGAVLACHLALRRSNDPKLRGLVLLAPAFGVTAARVATLQLVRPVRNFLSKGSRASDYFLDHRLYSYLQIPLDKAAEVLRFGREAVANMSKLRNLPVLMFAGDRESTVSLEKILSVARDNPWIQLVRLPRSRHILTVEPDKEMMFEASLRFMEQCVRDGG
jgi:carboxylesterase